MLLETNGQSGLRVCRNESVFNACLIGEDASGI